MSAPSAAAVTNRMRAAALAILFLVSLFNYLDRFALGILLPKIGAEMRLSDAELGFVTGGAFSVIYVVAALPLGRLADRGLRRLVIAGALLAWSVMTAACGLAQSFLQLALARIAVGIGQAGAAAPASALIADLFGPRHRAAALSVYAQGLPAGILVGFMAGGLLAEYASWRLALLAFAIPGVVLALFVAALLPEPSRAVGADGHGSAPAPMAVTMRSLFARRSYVHVCLGSALFTVVWLSLLGWLPTFFTRRFGLALGDIGLRLAPILGGSQMLGLLLGGVIGDRLARGDQRWYAWICAAASVLPVPFVAFALFWPEPDVAMLMLFPAFMFGLLQGAPALAMVQAIAGPGSRALATSGYLLVVNVLSGLGAQAIGLLSDGFRPSLGGAALGVAIMLVVLLCGLWSAVHFLLGARALPADLGKLAPA